MKPSTRGKRRHQPRRRINVVDVAAHLTYGVVSTWGLTELLVAEGMGRPVDGGRRSGKSARAVGPRVG